MNKVMVTGLAIGKEVGSCDVCHFDLSWVFNNPSTLLWADKIIFTPVMWDRIVNGRLSNRKEELSKAIKFVFERLNAEGIIEICEPSKYISNNLVKEMDEQVIKDMRTLSDSFPSVISFNYGKNDETGRISPDELKIGDYEYCPANLFSIYGGLLLSRLIGAQPLFDNRSFEYLKYRFGMDINNCQSEIKTFSSIFNSILPNDNIFPKIVLANDNNCNNCIKINTCKKEYLKILNDKIDDIIKWRKYDEIFQIKTVINNIIKDCNDGDLMLNSDDILKKYHEKENKINSLIKSTFPKVRRFANMATMVSLPFAVIGVAADASLITASGLSIAGLSQISKEVISLLESKFRWVGFLKKPIE